VITRSCPSGCGTAGRNPAGEQARLLGHSTPQRLALRTGKDLGGVDPVAQLPDNGIVTKANASQFTPEWPG
jgi:hypothetical protein